jgi:hypothetical protein
MRIREEGMSGRKDCRCSVSTLRSRRTLQSTRDHHSRAGPTGPAEDSGRQGIPDGSATRSHRLSTKTNVTGSSLFVSSRLWARPQPRALILFPRSSALVRSTPCGSTLMRRMEVGCGSARDAACSRRCHRADSLVLNPHKWLFTPFDLSVLYCRHLDLLRRAFSAGAGVPAHTRTGKGAQRIRLWCPAGPAVSRAEASG